MKNEVKVSEIIRIFDELEKLENKRLLPLAINFINECFWQISNNTLSQKEIEKSIDSTMENISSRGNIEISPKDALILDILKTFLLNVCIDSDISRYF